MSDLWWRLFGKTAIDFWIWGKQQQSYPDVEIFEMANKCLMGFTKRQIKYAKKKLLGETFIEAGE